MNSQSETSRIPYQNKVEECVCIYIYIYIYIYTHIFILVYIHIYVCVYIYIYVCVCVCMYLCIYIYIHTHTHTQAHTHTCVYTGCYRRNGPDFGWVFLRSNYTDLTQNTYIQSWTVTEILAREKSGLLWCLRTVLVSVTSFSPLLELHSYVRDNVAPAT